MHLPHSDHGLVEALRHSTMIYEASVNRGRQRLQMSSSRIQVYSRPAVKLSCAIKLKQTDFLQSVLTRTASGHHFGMRRLVETRNVISVALCRANVLQFCRLRLTIWGLARSFQKLNYAGGRLGTPKSPQRRCRPVQENSEANKILYFHPRPAHAYKERVG